MAKRWIAPLASGRIRLRLLEEADLPTTLAWRNQDHIRKWFLSPDVIDPARHRAWFDAYKERDDDFVFIIEETATLRRPVGQVALYHIDWDGGRAEFGRLMIGDEAARGGGLARAATSRLVDEALTRWGLREIRLECLASNARALALYATCRFQLVGSSGEIVTMIRHNEPAR
jgi:RimJ/RimL family protein N-acetyltransferase